MKHRPVLRAFLATTLLSIPQVAFSQDKNEFRTLARTAATQLRSVGEPKDRCTLNAFLGDGGLVARLSGKTSLQPGDRVVRINAVDVSSKSTDEIIGVLRGMSPAESPNVTIRREGVDHDLQVSCSNGRATNEAMLAALDQIAAGKFDDCVATLRERYDLGAFAALIAAQCANLSRNSKAIAGAMAYTATKMQIEDAGWVPSQRGELIERLQNGEGALTAAIGAAKFQELVALTKVWPGGERSYERATPDWSVFRRNAEQALKARLIDPDSARFEWTHGFLYGTWKPVLAKRVEGYWTCGTLNARNRMGGYTGSSSFVVVLDRSGTVKLADMGESRDFDLINLQCANSVKALPPAPAKLIETAVSTRAAFSSLADELKKLADLRSAGTITQAEFEAAKTKLLANDQ